MTKKTKKATEPVEKVEAETNNSETEAKSNTENYCEKNSETFSRIFFTILFGIIGWVTVWVFACVILVQFGFLLITGKVNKNLKAFNKEIGLYLTDMIKYLSFQTNEKPFPFRDWPYDDQKENSNTVEQNATTTVEVSK